MPHTRRSFFKTALAATTHAIALPAVGQSSKQILGQGEFRYRVIPNWGNLTNETPVKNCHGIVCDREGHIILLTDNTANNVIIYNKDGKLVHKWGSVFPGAHGLSLVQEGTKEVLFITDLQTHRVVKATLDGQILEEWRWPEGSGKYEKENQYRPSWTLHLPSGDFFVLDGYGRDYIAHYDSTGKFLRIFGGAEGGIPHWGPHGGMVDLSDKKDSTLLIAMSDQQNILRLSLTGEHLQKTELPGGNPRQIRKHNSHYFVGHLADNWPKDRSSRGFVSVLDTNFQVVSNIGGTAPRYSSNGVLEKMEHQGETFMHPHDLTVDSEESLYVAQFDSNQTYPIKLERV